MTYFQLRNLECKALLGGRTDVGCDGNPLVALSSSQERDFDENFYFLLLSFFLLSSHRDHGKLKVRDHSKGKL